MKKVPKQLKKWHSHLMAVRKKNPGKSMKQCMKIAKRSYKKK
jgi:hypothetical protein